MTGKLRLGLASVLAVCALGAIAPAANAYVYWASYGDSTIGRANNDGSSVNESFIIGATSPAGVAVDGNHIYWANSGSTIGRANLDGSGANQSFITGASDPFGIAVEGSHIYWANSGSGTIGRANLDGTSPNQSFITGASAPYGVAVNGNYIYWTNALTETIGRANLDGTGANQSFIPGLGQAVAGIAVNSNYIYWTNFMGYNLGRANLDGTGANNYLFTVGVYSRGVAVDGNYIYWASGDDNAIGRANLGGTSPNQSFIATLNNPQGVAVDSLPYPTISSVGKPTKRSLKVKVGCGDASACSLRITGNKVGVKAALVPKTVAVGAGQQPTVTLAYTRALKTALARGGRVSVTATNSATGGAKSITVRVAR